MGQKVDAFIKALKEINKIMKADNAQGNQWRYYNTKHGKKTFQATRKAGMYYTNCVSGVQYGLKYAGLATGEQCNWYGSKGIVWLRNGEKKAKEIFYIIDFKGKTVKDAIKDGTLKPGDIITYKTLSHTNVYLGDGKSFDAGHAYCKESGEGAKFIKWIGTTPYQGYQIAYVLRLKDDDNDIQPSKEPKWVGKVSYTEAINVKVGPGSKYDNLPQYPKLNPTNLIDICDETINEAGNKWYYVRIAGQYFGWVYAKHIVKA